MQALLEEIFMVTAKQIRRLEPEQISSQNFNKISTTKKATQSLDTQENIFLKDSNQGSQKQNYFQYQIQYMQFFHQLIYDQSQDLINLQYYLYNNLQQTVNLLVACEQIFTYFQDQPNHPMILAGIQRLVSHLNISNAIYHDQQNYFNIKQKGQEFKKMQGEIKQLFGRVQEKFKFSNHLALYVQKFADNFHENVQLNQTAQPYLNKTGSNQLTQSNVERLIQEMNQVENQLQNIQSSRQPQSFTLGLRDIQQTANDYSAKVNLQLQTHFPQNRPNLFKHPSSQAIIYSPNPVQNRQVQFSQCNMANQMGQFLGQFN